MNCNDRAGGLGLEFRGGRTAGVVEKLSISFGVVGFATGRNLSVLAKEIGGFVWILQKLPLAARPIWGVRPCTLENTGLIDIPLGLLVFELTGSALFSDFCCSRF